MWNYEGMIVEGMYLETFPIKGKVMMSRVAFGGRIKHSVAVDADIQIYGRTVPAGETLILDHESVTRVKDDRPS